MSITTKERIIIEAEKQFIQKGIANTQMKDIAEAVGINRRTLYRYYISKDVLAFEVEMIVMKQIQDYLSSETIDETLSGYEQVKQYFESFNLSNIRDLMRFTAEFDRYFQEDYPTEQLEQEFIERLDPKKDRLYQYISVGVHDGSIRKDLSVDEMFHFISQSFFALFQRILLREKHLDNEHCANIDFQGLFKKIVLNGIKNTP